jgi:hypothetical protein
MVYSLPGHLPGGDIKLSEKNGTDLNQHLIPGKEDELDEIMRGLLEIRERHGNKALDSARILEHIDIICQFDDIFERGTTDPNDFFTLADIEALYQESKSRLSELDFRNLLKKMTKLKGETELI